MPSRSKRRGVKRGAPVVRRTLEATLSELGRVGYASLRFETIAERANVNKTTVYRRWPTKEALVRDALLSLAERYDGFTMPDTGSLRGDLTRIIQRRVAFAQSREGRAILRVLNDAKADANLVAISQSLRANGQLMVRSVLERARSRGDLRATVDVPLFAKLLQVACERLRDERGALGPKVIAGLVDILVMGTLSHRK